MYVKTLNYLKTGRICLFIRKR